ncbi:hypothetical protein FQZ97_603950 [compost metagenome]
MFETRRVRRQGGEPGPGAARQFEQGRQVGAADGSNDHALSSSLDQVRFSRQVHLGQHATRTAAADALDRVDVHW